MVAKPTRTYCFDRLKGFDAVGFDFDFTLGRYNIPNIMKLIHEEMVRYLVDHHAYPEALLDTSFDENFCDKGLCIDKSKGLIIKLDPQLRVVKACFGRRFLNDSEIDSCYPEPLSDEPEFDKRFHTVYGPWTVPIIAILADFIEISGFQMDTVEPHVFEKFSKDITKSCYTLYDALNYPKHHIEKKIPLLEGQDWTKSPPNYFPSVLGESDKYFFKSDRLRFIEELRKAGKKTFVVTDSRFEFADVMLRWYFGDDYNRLFDIVLTHAAKSRTFSNDYRFEEVGVEGPDGFYIREEACEEVRFEELKQFHTYGGGNKAKLTEFLASLHEDTNPENLKILFVGDSLKSDVISLKKDKRYNWSYAWVQSEIEGLNGLDNSLIEEHAELDSRISDWGHMLKVGSGLSYYGAKVKRETDFIMSDMLELGGAKNPIKTEEFFELMEESSRSGSLQDE